MALSQEARGGSVATSSAEFPASKLFEGLNFWISQRCPQRSTFISQVRNHGGQIVALEDRANVKIVDHLRPATTADCYSYTFIEKSISNGVLEDYAKHRVGAPLVSQRTPGSSAPTKVGRTPFTAEDDRVLSEWVRSEAAAGGKVSGNEIYQQLAAINPRHTWQSWRDRWVKFISRMKPLPNIPPPTKPPTPPADDHTQRVGPSTTGSRSPMFVEQPGERHQSRSALESPQAESHVDPERVVEDVDPIDRNVKATTAEDFTEMDVKWLLKRHKIIINVRWIKWDRFWQAIANEVTNVPSLSQGRTAEDWKQLWVNVAYPRFQKREAELKRREENDLETQDQWSSNSGGVDDSLLGLPGTSPFNDEYLRSELLESESKKRRSTDRSEDESNGGVESRRSSKRQRFPPNVSEELVSENVQSGRTDDGNSGAGDQSKPSTDAIPIISLIETDEDSGGEEENVGMGNVEPEAGEQFNIFEDDEMEESQEGEKENMILKDDGSPSLAPRHKHERSAEALEAFVDAPMHFGLVSPEGAIVRTSGAELNARDSRSPFMTLDDESAQRAGEPEQSSEEEPDEASNYRSASPGLNTAMFDTQAILNTETQKPDLTVPLPTGDEADEEDNGSDSSSDAFGVLPPIANDLLRYASTSLSMYNDMFGLEDMEHHRDEFRVPSSQLDDNDDNDSGGEPAAADGALQNPTDLLGNDEENYEPGSPLFTQERIETQAFLRSDTLQPDLEVPLAPGMDESDDDEEDDEIYSDLATQKLAEDDEPSDHGGWNGANNDHESLPSASEVDNNNDDDDDGDDDEDSAFGDHPPSSSPPLLRAPARPASSSPSKIAHDTIELEVWMAQQEGIPGRTEERLVYALQRSTMDTELAERVLESLASGRGCPRDTPGIWTEEQDAVLRGNNTKLQERLRGFHGDDAYEDRIPLLREMADRMQPLPA